jgi:hypothetical protein
MSEISLSPIKSRLQQVSPRDTSNTSSHSDELDSEILNVRTLIDQYEKLSGIVKDKKNCR